ncbi:MAG: hypothetical protein HYY76_15345 [Acidobacteria bacterium]|nr:hypothetical protein [Acidobacteriota bacterium]
MHAYVFRLDERKSGTLQGIVTIFATERQEVWVRLATEEHAREIPDTVMWNETNQLRTELEALVPDATVGGGSSLLGQLFHDPAVVSDRRARFVGRREFPMLTHSKGSFQTYVDHWFQEVERQNRGDAGGATDGRA